MYIFRFLALVFNQGLMQLDQLEQNDVQKKCQFCLTACPSSIEQGIPLTQIDTLTIDSLFFQKFYKNPKNVKEIELKICSKPFKPAMVYDRVQKSYDIGYEVVSPAHKFIRLLIYELDVYFTALLRRRNYHNAY